MSDLPKGVLELKCPQCGANMNYDPVKGLVTCDYCGYRLVLPEENKEQMDKAQGIQPKTLTEQMAEKTKEEQEKHRREEEEAQKAMEQNGKSSRDAYDFGRFLMGMFTGGFGWHLRRFVRYVITFLICAVSAAAGFFVCKYLPVWTGADLASYNGYLLIVGAVLEIVGIFCLRISYKKAKSIPLGLGIGLLLAYFLKLWL
jgi:uncharacterized Zn finger protein (UPF0148 family)